MMKKMAKAGKNQNQMQAMQGMFGR